MKLIKLKKKQCFSLIAILLCCALFYTVNNVFNINNYINSKIENIKEKEMKYIYEQRESLGDTYIGSQSNYNYGNISYQENRSSNDLTQDSGYGRAYLLLQSQYINNEIPANNFLSTAVKYNNVTAELEKQIDKDSYRDKKLGYYYIFNFNYTMNALKELDSIIESVSEVQKVPKALLSSVLFREMMFLGQEDLLDGFDFIGGKSMGICQIGIENARFNEQIVHGKDSLIANYTDEEIKTMLQNPTKAVYFCAVQLKARAIKLTGKTDIDLGTLDEEQLHKVLEEYNQSKVKITIGPIKTKYKYADETLNYYHLFTKLYELKAENK